jgi:hypothetical protein
MKGDRMNIATRKTRACTLDTLDEELKAGIRAHGTKFGLKDLETDILILGRRVKGTEGIWGRSPCQGLA